MKKCIIEMLDLQGMLVDKIEVSDKEEKVFVFCRSPKKTAICPSCGKRSAKVHQTKVRLIRHDIISYREVMLHLKYRRFKCRACKKVFTEKFAGIDRCRASSHLMTEAMDWLRRNSFNFTSEQFKLSTSTLTRYLLKMTDGIEIDWGKANVTKMGIDEHSFRGKRMVMTITDISNHKLLAVLKSDSKKDLEEFLLGIPPEHREKIIEVCTDLRPSFGTVVKRIMPRVELVADRFHVELLARRTVDEIRSVVQEDAKGSRINLKGLLWKNGCYLTENERIKLKKAFDKYENFPVLKQSWIVKEHILNLYFAHDEIEAERRFERIMLLLESADESSYLPVLRRTLKRWKHPILNYFKSKTTNGFTEGCHTKIKMIKRVSFGFRSINNYIAKITLAFLPLIWIMNYHTC